MLGWKKASLLQHEVNLGYAYNTQEFVKKIPAFIAKSQRQDFFFTFFSESHFYSRLMDGTTDLGNMEDQLLVLVYCSKDDANQQMVTCTCFLTTEVPIKLMQVA